MEEKLKIILMARCLCFCPRRGTCARRRRNARGKGVKSQKNPSQAAILIVFAHHPRFTIFFPVAKLNLACIINAASAN
jgi:hypothetical protein